MQKISSYLYPNRVQLLADLTTFNVEYTSVYQRIVKIYNGIDNTIEFDIKNADQKRIDLSSIDEIKMNVMDAMGNALPNSPYDVIPTTMRGIASVTIPSDDLVDIDSQYLKYSVTGLRDNAELLLYCDTYFDAVGTLEVVESAIPIVRKDRTYTDFIAEIDLQGNPLYHSSSITSKFYEAVKTTHMTFGINVTNFIGSVWIDATTADTVSVESFRAAGKPFGAWVRTHDDGPFTGTIPFGSNIPVGDYSYFRVSYKTPSINGYGASFNVTRNNGEYTITISEGGTGYSPGSMIKVAGSQLGGIDGVNDLVITVNGIQSMGSSYTINGVISATGIGTAADGTGTYLVSGINYSGILDKVVVS